MKLQLQLAKKGFSQDGGCLGSFVVWMMLIFCLCPDMITERSCLCFDPPWSCLNAGILGTCLWPTAQLTVTWVERRCSQEHTQQSPLPPPTPSPLQLYG